MNTWKVILHFPHDNISEQCDKDIKNYQHGFYTKIRKISVNGIIKLGVHVGWFLVGRLACFMLGGFMFAGCRLAG